MSEMNMISGKRKKKFNLNNISRYRDQLFGLTIITIVLYHFSDDYCFAYLNGVTGDGSFIENILVFGYHACIGSIGVEIFLILSGMGLYYSYSKNTGVKDFYRRRFLRVLVPYLMVAAVFWGIKDFVVLDGSPALYISDIAFITFFTQGTRTIWFAGFILVMYVLFPFFYKVMFRGGRPCRRAVLLIGASFLLPAAVYMVSQELYNNIEIALTRAPCFLLGMAGGYYIKEGRKISLWKAAVFIAAGVLCGAAGVLIEAPGFVERYLNTVYSWALLIIATGFIHLICKWNIINRFLSMMGGYTLEIYMLHVVMRNLMKSFGFESYRFLQYMIMAAIAVALSPGLKRISSAIVERIEKAGASGSRGG